MNHAGYISMKALVRSLLLVSCVFLCGNVTASVPIEEFFDDLTYESVQDPLLNEMGWQIRTQVPGAPGPTNAQWEADNITFNQDPSNSANRTMTMSATAQGSIANPTQSAITTPCRFREGTFAARIRWQDSPNTGPDVDQVMQNFFIENSLRYDYDPDYSECDFEYMPNGGWGVASNILHCTTWGTYRPVPRDAVALITSSIASYDGWHIILIHVSGGTVSYSVDDSSIATHVGTNCPGDCYPESLMGIAFQTRFTDNGVVADNTALRKYSMDIDWVYHAKKEALSLSNVNVRVSSLREQSIRRRDTITDTVATVNGRIAYHTYSAYLAEPTAPGDGRIFVYRLDNTSNTAVTAAYPVDNAMHPHFSPNGDLLAFMAIPSGAFRSRTSLELYCLDLATAQLIRLTTNSVPDEEPSFHPNGKQIIFKRNGQLWTLSLAGGSERQLSTSLEDPSGPCFSPDGLTVAFGGGMGENADIWTISSDGMFSNRILTTLGVKESYPFFRDANSLLFTRWNSATDSREKLYLYNIAESRTNRLWINTDDANDMDGFPVDDDFVGFSSDRSGGKGGSDIYLDKLDIGKIVKLGEAANSSLHDLAGSYSPYTYARSLQVVTPMPNVILTGGVYMVMQVRAFSDGLIWTGASPRICFEGPWTGGYWDFVDNGTTGDVIAGDGVYSKTVKLPYTMGQYTVYAVARSVEPGGIVREVTSTTFSVSIVTPYLSVSPGSRDFGYIQVGSVTDALFTVENKGGGILTGSATVSSPFAVISGGSYNLPSGQTQTVTVRYSPSSTGSHSNNLIFTGGSGTCRPLTGRTWAPYVRSLQVVTPMPNVILTGGVYMVMQVRAFSDGLIWTGASPRICFEGPWTGGYWDFVDNGTTGDVIAGDGVYSKTVKLPYTMGQYTVYAVARSVEPGGIVREVTSTTFSVSIVTPYLSVSPGSRDFGYIQVGSVTDALFTVENKGGGILTGSATVSSPFAVISGGSYNLPSGQTQTVTVRYSPSSTGSHSNNLIFTGGSGTCRPLTGRTWAPYVRSMQVVTPMPNVILTGGVYMVMQVRAFSDGLIWTGASPRICFEGPWTGGYWDFVDNGTTGDVIAGDGVYSKTVKLPYTMGQYTVYAVARSVEPGGIVREVTSTTFSVSIVTPYLSVSPGSRDFGYIQVGSVTDALFTVENKGGGILTGSATVSSPFAVISGGSYNLPSGQTQTVTVRYSPSSTGSHSNNLIFTGGSGTCRPLTGRTWAPYVRSMQVVTPPPSVQQGAGIVLQWSSESNRLYHLLSSTNLRIGFNEVVASNIFATPYLNIYTDTPVNVERARFYKIVE